MTIKRGEPWGREVARPADLIIAASDAEAVRLSLERPDRPLGLSGGDLFRSLGSPGARDPVVVVDVDAIRVDLGDGTEHLAIAHVLARRSWWHGALFAAMNVDHLGSWNVAPRAHPADGLIDVVEVDPSMSVRDRWAARARLRNGTHLPHPAISSRRVSEASWRFEVAHRVWIDGVETGSTDRVTLTVRPDRFTVYA